MRVALGADHAGFRLKEALKRVLDEWNLHYDDYGTDAEESVDYPDYARQVGVAVASGRCARGILICRTGIGMAIAANKVAGVRAAVVSDLESARLAREHNDANVLSLGTRQLSEERAREIVRVFLQASFAGGRHQVRVDKIADLERNGAHVTSGTN